MSEQDVTPGGAIPVASVYEQDPWWHFGRWIPLQDSIRYLEDIDYEDATKFKEHRDRDDWIVS